MKPVSEITLAVIDTGLFLPMAHRLAEDCKRVIFAPPCEKTPCTVKSACIGDGFEDIEAVRDVWTMMDEIDGFVFPDCHHSGLQAHLKSMGKPVWGCGSADRLELNRSMFMRLLGELGLDVPDFVEIRGLSALRAHLKERDDKYIKVSRYRGDFETYHWRKYSDDEGWLDWQAINFGPTKELVKFLVFDAIETDLEIGADTYSIDGSWPDTILNGLEFKDKSYFAAVTKRDKMPEQITRVLDAFQRFLADTAYRQFWSMEVRVKGDKAYFIDATTRGGLPSSASQQLLWKNYSDIVWQGMNGFLVEPEPAAQFSIETMINVQSEQGQWDTVEMPKELQRNARLSSCAFIDGCYCFPPDDLSHGDLGWLCATGDSPKEVLDEIKRLADMLPDGLDAKVEDLAGVLKEIDTAHSEGIRITDAPVPEPATAIE